MARDQKPARIATPRSDDGTTRLNKWISECGLASRRKADELITEGAVLVNGKKVYELGTRVNPKTDRITVNGKPLKAQTQRVYILFNKPKNVVTTMNDPEGRPSISDYFERIPVRVFPVGRLDWDSEGMILLTNDGEFAQKVNHPKNEILKTYMVKVSGKPTDHQLEKLRTGVSIVGGRVSARNVLRVRKGSGEKDWLKISIAEGKNRQIRHMFEKIGFDVLKLQRVSIGRLKMPKGLERGEFVFLTEQGLAKIFEQEPVKAKPEIRQRSAKSEARDQASRDRNPSQGKTADKPTHRLSKSRPGGNRRSYQERTRR